MVRGACAHLLIDYLDLLIEHLHLLIEHGALLRQTQFQAAARGRSQRGCRCKHGRRHDKVGRMGARTEVGEDRGPGSWGCASKGRHDMRG